MPRTADARELFDTARFTPSNSAVSPLACTPLIAVVSWFTSVVKGLTSVRRVAESDDGDLRAGGILCTNSAAAAFAASIGEPCMLPEVSIASTTASASLGERGAVGSRLRPPPPR